MKTRGRPRHPDVLTPREWEVLTLVREGLTNPQIAERMGIRLDAAKYHVSEILSKLQLSSRQEAAAWQPEPPRQTVLRPSWASALGGWWPFIARTAGAGAIVAAVAGLAVLAYGVISSEGAEEPTVEGAPSATAAPNPDAPSQEVTELLTGFLEARVAGAGAYQYLAVAEEDVPLLYATTSGAPYERAEFEPVPDIEWPYGWIAFQVRLFAVDTVVEQLFFVGPDGQGLEYQPDGFGTDIAPTTEDGRPVADTYYFDVDVTLRAAHPWVFNVGSFGRLIPEGPGVAPTTDGGERNDWDELVLMSDPTVGGNGCQAGASPSDAEALAESIRSYPGLEATAPVAVSVGGAEALMMDVVMAAGTTIIVPTDEQGNLCAHGILNPVFDQNATIYFDSDVTGQATGQATGDWMRLYLFDAPAGSSMRVMSIAIIAPESTFERAVEAAAPVVESVEFHTP